MDLRHPRETVRIEGRPGAGGEKGAVKPAIPWRSKFKAFGAHLMISVALFTLIVAITIWLWYPPPFFWIDGALHVTVFAAIVDVIAGPLLTFVVYRPAKPRLVMNLSVIAAVQFAALAWGVHTMYSQRPLVAAFIDLKDNRFYPVTERQLREEPRPVEEVLALSRSRPALVYVELPEDPAEAAKLLSSRTTSVLRQSYRFRRIEGERLAQLARASRTRKTYEYITPHFAAGIDRFIAEHGGDPKAFSFIPLYGRFGYAILAISTADGTLAGVAAKEISLR
jgi:hypothetical protein